MYTCNYGKEPVDMRLFTIYIMKKIWIILLAAVLGALIVGGPYYLRKVTFGPAKEYQTTTDFYVDYAKQETGEEYVYFNQTTWTQLMTDDIFLDEIVAQLAENGNSAVSKQELQTMIFGTMLSDTRIVTATVKTNNPELSMDIQRALIDTMIQFGQQQKEIAEVRILEQSEEAELVKADVRTFRACMLGAVIFAFVATMYFILYFALDDSIYIPLTISRRYGIEKTFAVERTDISEEIIQQCGTNKVITVGANLSDLKEEAVVLAIPAGAHNGRQIEETIYLLQNAGCRIDAAVLTGADSKLQKVYYAPEHIFKAKK